MIEIFLSHSQKVLQWRPGVLRSVMTLAQMLRSRSRDELNVAGIVHATLVAIDGLIFLVLPSEPTRLVALEADLINVDGVADDWRLEPKLNGIGSWRNPVFEQLHVDVFHHFH